MKIAVLGTGMVGKAHAAKLTELGHEVWMGTRDPEATLARTERDFMGNPPVAEWLGSHQGVRLAPFAEAAGSGEIAFNCLRGDACVPVLSALQDELVDKLLVDISNPLDYSQPGIPTLTVSNTDSLAEEIQRALPATKVVKTLSTVNAMLQVDPLSLAEGDHDIFVSGDDAGARECITGMLKDWYGWKNVIDLGDITTARGPEMYMPLWLRLWGAVQAPSFNIKIVRG